jgi:hypothetical protein
LAISEAPMMLNTFQMPLVNDYNDFLALTLIDLFEEILVSFVYKNFL